MKRGLLTVLMGCCVSLPAFSDEATHLPSRRTVRVSAESAIAGAGKEAATAALHRELALKAVEQVAALLSDSDPSDETLKQTLDSSADDPGIVVEIGIVDQEEKAGLLKMTADVVVDAMKLGGVLRKEGLAHRWRVMVVIPEYHITHPIRDPAAETEFIRLLVQAGYKVIDQARYAELRYQEAERLKDPEAAAEIARRMGADVIITGEAFSELTAPVMGLISCRARVEVRTILADTAEIVAADAAHAGGADASEAVAAKKALTAAANTLVPAMIADVGVLSPSRGSVVQLEVGPFRDLGSMGSFERGLRALKGVAKVSRESYEAGMAVLEVRLSDLAPEAFAEALETNAGLKPFGLGVTHASKTRIRAEIRKAK